MERYAAQVQDLQNIRVAQLILQSYSEKIKLPDRILGLEREQRDLLLPHDLIQIDPRRIDPLTPCVGSIVKHLIQDLNSEMGHPYLIDIRKAHNKTDVRLRRILADGINFISKVTFRLSDREKDLLGQRLLNCHTVIHSDHFFLAACFLFSAASC